MHAAASDMADALESMWARWSHIQSFLFPWMREEIDPLTEALARLVAILDVIGLEAFVPGPPGGAGRPKCPSRDFSSHLSRLSRVEKTA